MTGRLSTILFLAVSFAIGCAHPVGHARVSQPSHSDPDTFRLVATSGWTDSPLTLASGDAVDISATGWVRDRLPPDTADAPATAPPPGAGEET